MKTVIVTGGTTRLGQATTECLRARGWRVITSSHRPDAGADLVADLAEPLGPAMLYAAALRLLDGCPPDALVNNAALYADAPARLEALNVQAPKKLTMLMAGRETGRGAVVNVLDADALRAARSDDSPYLKTKRALLEDTRKAAVMFAETLRVNAVAPGAVLVPDGLHVRAPERLLSRPRPEDVASAVAYLLDAEATTGAVLPVDGGQAMLEAFS